MTRSACVPGTIKSVWVVQTTRFVADRVDQCQRHVDRRLIGRTGHGGAWVAYSRWVSFVSFSPCIPPAATSPAATQLSLAPHSSAPLLPACMCACAMSLPPLICSCSVLLSAPPRSFGLEKYTVRIRSIRVETFSSSGGMCRGRTEASSGSLTPSSELRGRGLHFCCFVLMWVLKIRCPSVKYRFCVSVGVV